MDFSDPSRGIPDTVFPERRARVFERLGDGVMVLGSAPTTYRSRDTEHAYRPDSELFYLTGVAARDVTAVFDGASGSWTLFVPERDAEAELWGGVRIGPAEAADRFGATHTRSADRLSAELPALLDRGRTLHVRLGVDPGRDAQVLEALRSGRKRGARRGTGPRAVRDPGGILDEMRLIKEPWEVERIRSAVNVTLEGHRAAREHARPGAGEWEVEAEVEAAFRRAGATGPAFDTIVGSGPNGGVLHYVDNVRTLEAGDLVLVDAGAEVALYCGDVTRTFPADGRFTPAQRVAYTIVDRARAAGVAASRPGATIGDVHDAACRAVVEGLVEADVLRGNPDELLARDAWRAFFPHQTSHWLGLDVHDPGDYARDGASRILEPGMVFTVEPGLYFRDVDGSSGGPEVPDAFRGIGIRVEDDVLITEDGAENLSAALPTELASMERRGP